MAAPPNSRTGGSSGADDAAPRSLDPVLSSAAGTVAPVTTEHLGGPEPTPQRRIAVLPFVIVALAVVAGVIFGLVVLGLAGATPSAPEPPGAAASVAPSPVPSSTPEAQQRPPAGPNECVDERGDGHTIDIDSVAMARDGERLRVVIVLADPVPTDSATLGVYARGGESAYELVSLWDDGEINEMYAVRIDNDDNDDRDGERDDDHGNRGPGGSDQKVDKLSIRDVTVEGSVIVVYFPKDALRRLGDTVEWYAYAKAGDEVVDSCPGGVTPDGVVPFVG